MKFKYIKTIAQGTPDVIYNESRTPIGLSIQCNVLWEIVETGTTIPDNYKSIERSVPALSVSTTDVVVALQAIQEYGLNWLKQTFGENNIIS